jgi:ADP-ribose pyrophosphatase YjhB (NUDIX family)
MVNMYVLVFLCINNDTVLLLRRCTQDFGNGLYSMVGGKVEQGETALQAIKREVFEEIGLDIPAELFLLVHVLHRKGTETEFVALCFKVDISAMQKPYNKEPGKHDIMDFFKINEIPENIIPAHKQVIECINDGIVYSEHGWE